MHYISVVALARCTVQETARMSNHQMSPPAIPSMRAVRSGGQGHPRPLLRLRQAESKGAQPLALICTQALHQQARLQPLECQHRRQSVRQRAQETGTCPHCASFRAIPPARSTWRASARLVLWKADSAASSSSASCWCGRQGYGGTAAILRMKSQHWHRRRSHSRFTAEV
jgi:hypothetical protein